jgi:hypothetical protein
MKTRNPLFYLMIVLYSFICMSIDLKKSFGENAFDEVKTTPTKSMSELTSPSYSQLTPCGEKSKVGKLIDVMLEPGNQWTYLYYESSSDEFLSDWGERVYTVKEKKRFGAYLVAFTKVKSTSQRSGKTRSEVEYRIAKRNKLCIVPHYSETLAEKIWANVSKKWVRNQVKNAYFCWKIPSRRGRATVSCLGPQCIPTYQILLRDISEAKIGSPAGFISTSYAEYSGETGDGHGEGMALRGYRLTRHLPMIQPVVRMAPDSFTRFAHDLALKIRSKGATDALKKSISESWIFAINGGINQLNWDNRNGLASLSANNNRGGKILAQLLEGTCGQVKSDGVSYILCPITTAQEYAMTSWACGYAPRSTQARAAFEKEKGGWRLTSFLLGGTDDIYTGPFLGPFAPLSQELTIE